MGVPYQLVRVLNRPTLSQNVKLKPEQGICVDLANRLRAFSLEGRLRCVWWHTPNEIGFVPGRLGKLKYAVARAMGLIAGAPDYVFIGEKVALLVEMKTETGTRSEQQKDFETWCVFMGLQVHLCRSVADVETLLTKNGLLLK